MPGIVLVYTVLFEMCPANHIRLALQLYVSRSAENITKSPDYVTSIDWPIKNHSKAVCNPGDLILPSSQVRFNIYLIRFKNSAEYHARVKIISSYPSQWLTQAHNTPFCFKSFCCPRKPGSMPSVSTSSTTRSTIWYRVPLLGGASESMGCHRGCKGGPTWE